jgi:ribonuclease P protein component
MNAQPGYARSGPDRDGMPSVDSAQSLRLDRLKRRSDFLRVAATRRRAAMPGLVLQIAETPADATAGQPPTGHETARIGYTASRKVGGAVQRNRARRRLRAAVGRVMPAHAASQRDYVVIARKGTLDRPFERLVGDLEAALKRLDAWRPAP